VVRIARWVGGDRKRGDQPRGKFDLEASFWGRPTGVTEQPETPGEEPASAAGEESWTPATPRDEEPTAVEPGPTPQPPIPPTEAPAAPPESAATAELEPPPEPATAAAPPPPPASQDSPNAGPTAAINERPELAVGGAFAGGFILAMILRRLAR
jgi:hypothetical protein